MAEDCEDKKKERLRHLAGEQAFELQLIKTSYAPHHCRVAAEQAAEAALNGSSARKAPQGEAAKRLTIFAEKNEGSEFFQARGSL